MKVTTWSLQRFRPAPQPPRGGGLLEHGIAAAWSLPERSSLPPAARVWVHTCSLDGPAALANYQARGPVVYAEEITEETRPAQSPGPWAATTGRPPAEPAAGP